MRAICGIFTSALSYNSLQGGWGLEIRQSGSPFQFFLTHGGYDVPAKFTIDIDPLSNQVWGTYDYGSGAISTPQYSILPSTLSAINQVSIGFDWRGTKGIQVDNIVVSTVPLPGAAVLLISGLGAILTFCKSRRNQTG